MYVRGEERSAAKKDAGLFLSVRVGYLPGAS